MGADPSSPTKGGGRLLDSVDAAVRQVFVDSTVQAVAMSNVEHVDRLVCKTASQTGQGAQYPPSIVEMI